MGYLVERDLVLDKTGIDKIFCLSKSVSIGRWAVARECKSVPWICVYSKLRKHWTSMIKGIQCHYSATREGSDCYSPNNIQGMVPRLELHVSLCSDGLSVYDWVYMDWAMVVTRWELVSRSLYCWAQHSSWSLSSWLLGTWYLVHWVPQVRGTWYTGPLSRERGWLTVTRWT